MTEYRPLQLAGLRIAQVVGAVWTLPNTLVGLIGGGAALLGGARATISDGGIVFHDVPFGPGGALTLGQVILHTGDTLDRNARTYHCQAHGGDDCVRVGDHERAHIYQYLALGPLFLPLYFLCGGISWRNRFEQSADRYAQTGKGWWPWPRPDAPPPSKPLPEIAQPSSDKASIN